MFKKIIVGIIILILGLVFWQFRLISYGIQQGIGQLHIVWNARPVTEYLEDPAVADSVKQKLRFIQKVRRYAIDSLGLNDTDNYTSMYDQHGQPVLWVVTGCKPFAFEPWEWSFPVVGTVPYKGFFDQDRATVEMEKVQAHGYDAGVRTVGGWSTLGWFRDPILSEMLTRNWGDLANLIIHEMSHATIFVKDSINFNENLASFIGDKGARLFLEDMYGSGTKEYMDYIRENQDEALYYEHILRGADQLTLLYNGFRAQQDSVNRQQQKDSLITDIMKSTDTLQLSFPYIFQDKIGKNLPNNTYFMSFMRYREKQRDLTSIFDTKFNGNLKAMIETLKEKHPFL